MNSFLSIKRKLDWLQTTFFPDCVVKLVSGIFNSSECIFQCPYILHCGSKTAACLKIIRRFSIRLSATLEALDREELTAADLLFPGSVLLLFYPNQFFNKLFIDIECEIRNLQDNWGFIERESGNTIY